MEKNVNEIKKIIKQKSGFPINRLFEQKNFKSVFQIIDRLTSFRYINKSIKKKTKKNVNVIGLCITLDFQ